MPKLVTPNLIRPLSEAQQACIELLREALKEAESGHIHSIGIAVCLESGYATVMAGSRAAELNMACDSLKKKILNAVEGAGKPNILRGMPS